MQDSSKNTGILDQLTRQLIVIVVALIILSWGIWTLIGSNAPYHPDDYSEVERAGAEVTRDSTDHLLAFRPPATRGTVRSTD